MYKRIQPRTIKAIVYPGNFSTKTRFKEVNILPILSFRSSQETYHIFSKSDWDTTRFFIVIEFREGIVYEPIEISQEWFTKINKSITHNTEVINTTNES